MERRDTKRGKQGEREGKKEDRWVDGQTDSRYTSDHTADSWTCMYRSHQSQPSLCTSRFYESVGSTLLFEQDSSFFAMEKVWAFLTGATYKHTCQCFYSRTVGSKVISQGHTNSNI